jgi:hypothetical protein
MPNDHAQTPPEQESTAEREGIVDQQDAVLEAMQQAEPQPDDPAEPGTGNEAPTG